MEGWFLTPNAVGLASRCWAKAILGGGRIRFEVKWELRGFNIKGGKRKLR
jgi:hypothetical protein